MTEERLYEVVLSSPTDESLPPYSATWGNDVIEKKPKKRWNWGSWSKWPSSYQDVPKTFRLLWDQAWPTIKRFKPSLKQLLAFSLLASFGILPLGLLGHFTRDGGTFSRIFQDKVQTCGNSFGTPENATVTGIENLFVLDNTFGRFTFSQAKTIDVVWDVVIGRGVQLLAWWIGYVVFCDALLRAIERHPASFEIFQRIALEGPSLHSLWTLVKEQWCAKSKRTRALFFFMWLSTIYIISIPMFISAMTGYDSTSIPWVSLEDSNPNNIVATSMLKQSWIVHNVGNVTFGEGVCMDYTLYSDAWNALSIRRGRCDCQTRNGTIVSPLNWARYGGSIRNFDRECILDFPGNNQTFTMPAYYYGESSTVGKCASSFNITINDKPYDAINLNGTSGYCYNSKPYDYTFLQDRTRCLPDTSNPTYQWGFSTMLSGLFVFFHFGWVVTMYIVWQDAQLMSTLVKTGYQMTPLRAAFAMAKAAKRKTGMGEKQLVRANTKELEQELYGTRKSKGTKVEYGIFEASDEEHGEVENIVRRRIAVPKDSIELSKIPPSSGSSSKPTVPP